MAAIGHDIFEDERRLGDARHDEIDSAVVVAIHNNGGGGSGTETWYDTTNGHEAESRKLDESIW